MKELISVIVPVYNVEKYLDKCIDSIVHQTYEELEIILVDDGSRDSSGELCNKWQRKDSRIKVIHKENAGLGFARNSGLDIATGQYVLYIDSDDYISVNMIEKLYKKSKETQSDTVYCGLTRVFVDGKESPVPAVYNNRSFTGEQIVNDVLLEMIGSNPQDKEDAKLFMSVWHAIYSMDIIREHNIRFPSERQIMCEDIMYHIDYLRHARKVTYISDCLYYYRVNPKSLSQVYDATRFERQKILSRAIMKELDEFVDPAVYVVREQRRLLGGARLQIQAIVASKEKSKISLIREICTDKELAAVLRTYPYEKNPFKHRIFNACIKHNMPMALMLLSKAILAIRK